MSRPWRAPALFAAVLALGCAPSSELRVQDDAAVEALLRLHHEQRVAHVLRASDRLTASFADPFVEVSRGAVSRRTRTEATRRFDAYFAAARFSGVGGRRTAGGPRGR